jgi:hypothetical protein
VQADLHVRIFDGADDIDAACLTRHHQACRRNHHGNRTHRAFAPRHGHERPKRIFGVQVEFAESDQGSGAMGGPALLDVDPTHAITFDLVIGKTLESSLFIRNPRSSPIVFKVPLKRLRAFCTVLAARAQTIARSAPPSTSLRLPAAPSASSMRIITHFRTVRAIHALAPERGERRDINPQPSNLNPKP